MKYLYAYLKTLYYSMGVMGIICLVCAFFIPLEVLPAILLYISFFVAFAGPIKLIIENNA